MKAGISVFKFKINNKLSDFFLISIILILAAIVNTKEIEAQEYQISGVSVAGNQSEAGQDSKAFRLIRFSVTKESQISINIFDLDNKLVKIFAYDSLQPGIYECDLTDGLQAGKYKCKINSGESSESFDFDLK